MTIRKSFQAWFVVLVGALFFFYAFFQVNMMGPLNQYISQAFKADASQVGLLSAFYFYANIIFMLPAGLLLDRFPVRKLFLFNMLLVIAGTLIFASSTNLAMASFARFLCGIMMAFGLVSCLKLASQLLPPERMALASSLIVTIGMVGGIFSHLPMERMITAFGWRGALIGVSFIGLLILLILWGIVKVPPQKVTPPPTSMNVWKSLFVALKRPQNWYCGLFTCFLNLPVAILGALFGITYLTQVYMLDPTMAASITSMLFFGMIFGSPFFGWLSDFMKKRKLPMFLGAIFCLLFMMIILYVGHIHISALYFLFFAVGFTSGSQVLGYPVISETNPPHLTGTALSLAAILIMGIGYGLGLPFVGKLLDVFGTGKVEGGVHIYANAAYQKAFFTIPIGIIISMIMVALIKETNCKQAQR